MAANGTVDNRKHHQQVALEQGVQQLCLDAGSINLQLRLLQAELEESPRGQRRSTVSSILPEMQHLLFD